MNFAARLARVEQALAARVTQRESDRLTPEDLRLIDAACNDPDTYPEAPNERLALLWPYRQTIRDFVEFCQEFPPPGGAHVFPESSPAR